MPEEKAKPKTTKKRKEMEEQPINPHAQAVTDKILALLTPITGDVSSILINTMEREAKLLGGTSAALVRETVTPSKFVSLNPMPSLSDVPQSAWKAFAITSESAKVVATANSQVHGAFIKFLTEQDRLNRKRLQVAIEAAQSLCPTVETRLIKDLAELLVLRARNTILTSDQVKEWDGRPNKRQKIPMKSAVVVTATAAPKPAAAAAAAAATPSVPNPIYGTGTTVPPTNSRPHTPPPPTPRSVLSPAKTTPPNPTPTISIDTTPSEPVTIDTTSDDSE